mmetsp:Transcript_18128/g.38074  ORF Transcript_18128/g.38074 Transcript_18128/m.38074 type:complete len:88 (-) Transcript_18128:111-374(-)
MTFVGPVKGHFDSDVLEAPETGHLGAVFVIVVVIDVLRYDTNANKFQKHTSWWNCEDERSSKKVGAKRSPAIVLRYVYPCATASEYQ